MPATRTNATGPCDQCQVVYVNGVRTHERGCPVAWKDYERECKWCGRDFVPAERHQTCCCESCQEDYNT